MKVGSGFLLGRKRCPLVSHPKTLFQAFEGTSIGSSGPERRSRIAHGSFGRFRRRRRATFLGFERSDVQTLANAVKLASREITSSLEPRFETSPLGFTLALRTRRRPRPSPAGFFERHGFAARSPLGFAECSRVSRDLLPPERHERL